MDPSKFMYRMLENQYVNQYHLRELLGVGGFGGVYRASEEVRNQVMSERAVKLIISDDSDKQLKELQAGINLRHPHFKGMLRMGIDRPHVL